jgi:radical SAM protein with 4Fe4S-binding SPASM domain
VPKENQERNNQEYAERKALLSSFPYEVQIGADNRCNLRCGFCLAEAYRKKGRLHLQDQKMERNPLQIFQALTTHMRYWKFLSLTGPGESLLNPKLDQILQLVRDHSGCFISITTNGVLINERLVRTFLNSQVEELSISLDSLDKEVFEELRVNAKLEKVLRGIQILKEEKSKVRSDLPRVNLVPTFFKKNIRELPNFIRFAARHDVQAVQASPGQVYRKSWISESLLHFPDLTRRMALKSGRQAERLGIRFINNLGPVYLNRGNRLLAFFRRREKLEYPTDPSTCRKPWSSIYIEPDGEVRPCCYQSPVYGNIYKQSLSELLNGENAQSLRRSMAQGNPPNACKNCYEFNRHVPEIMISLDAVPPEPLIPEDGSDRN